MSRHIRWLIFILVLSAFALWVSLPDTQSLIYDSNQDGEPEFTLNIQQALGLDLVGGLRILLKADLPASQYTAEDLRQTANNVSKRIDALGVAEATIQVLEGSGRILVELPGVSDPEQAVSAIQQTALLEFVDFAGLRGQLNQLEGQRILTTEQLLIQQQRQEAASEATPEAAAGGAEATEEPQANATPDAMVNPLTRQPFETVMTGAGLQAAAAQYDPSGNRWFIQFELNRGGSELFGPYTASHVSEPMAIVLDSVVLSAPIIQAELTTGGVIEGDFTEAEAKTLALQLRSGALPIPLSVESTEQVGASLGQESISLSIRAGIIGVITVLTFMMVYYRVPGLAADLALLIFIVLNLAVFKLVPITLTLPAITGFLIGIGTAVDGNILIFERIKEELRAGKPLDEALEAGFNRAWGSIRDSNLSTIIICAILFFFGQTPGASIVSGFAVTLGLGLVINLFTAVLVTRTFLHVFVALLHQPLVERKWLLGV
jgi:protein-export membrane protein SecD